MAPIARSSPSHRRLARLLLVCLVLSLSLSLAGTAAARLVRWKLSGDLQDLGDVADFALSPDGRYAVFLADAVTNNVPELFSVPTAGGTRTPLNPPLAAGTRVLGFAIAPGGQSVVYWTSPGTGKATALGVAGIAGLPRLYPLAEVQAGDWLSSVAISADSRHAVFIRHQPDPANPGPDREQIRAVPLDGAGASVDLTELCSVACTRAFQLAPMGAPAGADVVHEVHGVFGPTSLYVVSVAGAGLQLASIADNWAVTPDGQQVIYQDGFALYSLPILGGPLTTLSAHISTNNLGFQVSPDSDYVVYRSDQLVGDRFELFAVPLAGGPVVPLLEKVGITPNGDVMAYQIVPTGERVVYLADRQVDEQLELYAVTMDGQSTTKLSGAMTPGGDVTHFAITPNSLAAVFIADRLADGTDELFVGQGAAPVKLSASLPAGQNVLDFQISPNSGGVVYRADQDTRGVFNLYVAPTLGGAAPARVNGPLVATGDVSAQYAITPDNRGVVYVADQERDEVLELFATFDWQPRYLPLILR